jgi:hypothetical protein
MLYGLPAGGFDYRLDKDSAWLPFTLLLKLLDYLSLTVQIKGLIMGLGTESHTSIDHFAISSYSFILIYP